MEAFFRDPNEPVFPPQEVRIKELRVEPRPDGQRVRVFLRITAFQKRPSGEVRVLNALGHELARANFIEALSPRMEFTLHLRGEVLNPHRLQARIFYLKEEMQLEERPEEIESALIVVDQAQVDFEVPMLS
ncbi:MAG: hypothetical protein NZ840_00875 [Anaerolineales bacterium]|nr:hypothetical protein [Anaerolineales bacterium]MDW8160589.1 hypothetical protein [Anaerolineales bacterium]